MYSVYAKNSSEHVLIGSAKTKIEAKLILNDAKMSYGYQANVLNIESCKNTELWIEDSKGKRIK